MTKDFKKFLTESELKLDPSMRVGDTLRLNINAKEIVEMTITNIEDGKITVEAINIKQGGKPNHDPDQEWTHASTGRKGKITRPSTDIGGKDGVDISWDDGETETLPRDRFQIRHGMSGTRHSVLDKSPWGVKEAAKPDFLDFDHDGDKDEPMKKALKDKEEGVSEGSASSIASRIKSLIDSGATVDSQAAGRVGKIVNVDGDFVSIRTVAGKKGVTRFDRGDEVKLFKRKDGTYVVRNTGAGASEWGFGPGKGDQSVDEAAKPDYLDFDKDGDKEEPMAKALKDKEDKVNESADDQLHDIVSSYPQEVEKFHNGGDLSDDLYASLFDYYLNNGEMPYETAKARGGDPMEWITQKFDQDLKDLGYPPGGENSQIDEILKLSGVKAINKEPAIIPTPTTNENRGNIFATILKNAGLKTVTESDLNAKLNEGTMAHGIFDRDPKKAMMAIKQLEALLRSSQPITTENASKKLYGLVFDDQLFDLIDDVDPGFDLRKHFSVMERLEELLQAAKDDLQQSNVQEGIGKKIKRAFQGWSGEKGLGPKDVVSRVRSADDDLLNYASKNDAAPHSPAGLQKAAAQQELKRRQKKTFNMNEGKIVVDNQSYDLTLNNAKRTWTANVWTTKKVF